MQNTIEREILDRYLNLLSPDGFCMLLRFYLFYLDNKEKGYCISIPSHVFQKHILISDDKERSEYAWGELVYWELVERIYQENSYILKTINILGLNEDFKVNLTDNQIKIRRKRNTTEYLDKYIERVVSNFTNQRLSTKVAELICGHVKFLYGEKGKIEISDIKELTDPFFEVPQIVLEKTCDIYIANYYAKKPSTYIHGIMRQVQKERSEKTVEKDDLKTLTLKQYRSELETGNLILAEKIASGNIEDNIAYQSYLKTKDFSGLNKLYEMGCKILIDDKREKSIKKDYDWIKRV